MIKRIIPKIDIKGNSLVKGVNLEGLRVLGDPAIFAKKYYEDGADEIIYHDVVASLYDQSTIFDLISNTARNIFVPLTVAGGIRSIEDIKKMLLCGADKVAINSQAIKKKNFINTAAEIFGSSTIIISIETMQVDGDFYVFYEYGRVNSGIRLVDWIEEVQNRGAGEILITSIASEGMGKGFDEKIIKFVNEKIKVPFLINGGCGSKKDILDIEKSYIIDGYVISSILHYDFIKNYKSEFTKLEGNVDFITQKNEYKNYETSNLIDLKKFLKQNKIKIR